MEGFVGRWPVVWILTSLQRKKYPTEFFRQLVKMSDRFWGARSGQDAEITLTIRALIHTHGFGLILPGLRCVQFEISASTPGGEY